MRARQALIGLSAAMLLIGLLAGSSWAQRDTRMWYRGYFEGPVDVRNRPQPGYYYHPAPNTSMPLFEHRQGYPLICPNCGVYYRPGVRECGYCHVTLPGRQQGVDYNTVYSPYQLPGQYWYQEQPHYNALTATRNLGPRYLRYRYPWD
jgi:hypothetical protein